MKHKLNYTIEVGSKLWGGWGERKRERAFYFFEYCYFYRDTQPEPLFIYLFSNKIAVKMLSLMHIKKLNGVLFSAVAVYLQRKTA